MDSNIFAWITLVHKLRCVGTLSNWNEKASNPKKNVYYSVCVRRVCAYSLHCKEMRKEIEFEVVKIIDVCFGVLADLKRKRNYHFRFAFSLRTHKPKTFSFFLVFYLSFFHAPSNSRSLTDSHSFPRFLCAEAKLIDLFSTMQNDNCHIALLHRTMPLLDVLSGGWGLALCMCISW